MVSIIRKALGLTPRLISFNRKSFCARGADEKFSILLLLAARLRHVIHARDVDDVNRMKHARSSFFSLLHLSKNMFRDLRALHRAANGRKLRNTLRQDCHRFARRLCHKSLCNRLWCFAGMSWTSFSRGKFFSLTAFFWRSANNRRSIEIFMPCSCFRETTSREPYLCRLELREKKASVTLWLMQISFERASSPKRFSEMWKWLPCYQCSTEFDPKAAHAGRKPRCGNRGE